MSSQNWNIYKQEKGMNMIGKKLKQAGKGILLAALFGASIAWTGETVFAEDNLSFSGAKQGGDEDGIISIKESEDGSGLHMEYQYEKDGYHTITVFCDEHVRKIEQQSSLLLTIKNDSKTPVRMNIEIIDAAGEIHTVSDGCYVVLRDKTTDTAPTEQGCFAIPAGFEGELEVPLELLAEDGLDEIMGYGLVCVAEDQNAYRIDFTDAAIKEDGTDPKETAGLLLNGPDEIRKAKVGESETQYDAETYNLFGERKKAVVSLSLKEDAKEIELTDEGWLVVKAGAAEEELTLVAQTADGLKAEKKITLQSSWTESIHTENGYDASIASPQEIAPVDGKLAFLVTAKALNIVRVAGVILTAAVLIYYIVMRRKAGRKE